MCKYTQNNRKYALYAEDKNYRLFILKKILINMQTYVRDARTSKKPSRRRENTGSGRYFMCISVDSLKKVL